MKRTGARGAAGLRWRRPGLSCFLCLVVLGAGLVELPVAAQLKVASALTQTINNTFLKPRPWNFRPHAGQIYESIEFGAFARDFYNVDVPRSTFTVDLVLTLRWNDERTKRLVQYGAPTTTLTKSAAASQMWLPDVVLTNRNINQVDTISSTVRVKASGSVIMVERYVASLENLYNVAAFPFDEQLLIVRLASSSLMWDDLRLHPIQEQGVSGVNEQAFQGKEFAFVSTETVAVEEVSSSLIKSRGEFRVRVARHSRPYLMSILLPEILILGISWAVFWLPLLSHFAMPRVATALFSFLSLLTLSNKTNQMLPVRAGLSWIDLFETCCLSLMFFTVIVNTFVLVIYNSFGETEFAEKVDIEMRWIFLVLALVLFGIMFYNTDGTGLAFLSAVSNTVLCLFFLVYICGNIIRLYFFDREIKRKASESTISTGVNNSKRGSV